MNWTLILKLSTFGLAMGLATVFFIPSTIEPVFWGAIFLICAYLIAKHCPEKRFFNGLLLGMLNSVWITAAHLLFFDRYIAGHAREFNAMKDMAITPQAMMIFIGAFSGITFGTLIGLLSMLAGKVMGRKAASVA